MREFNTMSKGTAKILFSKPVPISHVALNSLTSLWIAISALATLLCGCPHVNSGLPPPLRMPYLQESSPAEGTYHQVKAGETLEDIAAKYGVDPEYVAEINNLESPESIRENVEIFVPKSPTSAPDLQVQSAKAQKPSLVTRNGEMAWPVKGKVVSGFGVTGGVQRNGISIEASPGASVVAAKDGTVGHVGMIPGYGNVVLIEHPDRLVTVYAHLNETTVRQGDKVKQGATIGKLGTSGLAEKPRLYFEVRSKSKPRNPMVFLKKTLS